MIIALLIIIILLLIGVVALLVTGWTLTETNDIERTGQDIRRELAQHRADTVRLLHSMRVELEDSLREVIEQKFDAFEVRQSRGSSRRRRSGPVNRDMNTGFTPASPAVNDDEGMEDDIPSRNQRSAFGSQEENERQFQLFPAVEPLEKKAPSLEEQMRSLLEQPKPRVVREDQPAEKLREKGDDEYISMIRVLPADDLYDDIPDLENLQIPEEPVDIDTPPGQKTIRPKSGSYIDDIPDIEDL
jgi:hypothetical protein